MGLGLVATFAIGALTFALERRLPYKRMLVVTGVLIALVLVVLVGNTMRTLQGVGWLSITPLDVEVPLWMGTWLGVFPTVETLVAQALAFTFVIGSYCGGVAPQAPPAPRGPRAPRARRGARGVDIEPAPDREPELAGSVARSGCERRARADARRAPHLFDTVVGTVTPGAGPRSGAGLLRACDRPRGAR